MYDLIVVALQNEVVFICMSLLIGAIMAEIAAWFW
jgi:hypothetical protein